MKLYDLLLMAKENLTRRKLRTALTSIGIVIGTISILLIISLGIGVKDSLNKKFAKSGSGNIIEVRMKEKKDKNKNARLSEEIRSENLVNLDLDFIRKIDGVTEVIPMINMPAKIMSSKYEANITIAGVEESKLKELGYTIAEGDFLSGEKKPEAVFASDVYKYFTESRQSFSTARKIEEKKEEEYYEETSEEGYKKYLKKSKVDLMNDRFKLTLDTSTNENQKSSMKTYPLINKGILMKGVLYQDNYIYMPMNYVIKMINENKSISNSNYKLGYDVAYIKISTANGMKEILKILTGAGYYAEPMDSILKEFKKIINILQIAFGAVAAISLIVASIGITNTMIMSVNERTKEIGVMKVIGATIKDIRNLFLLESAIIGALGGTLGILFTMITAKIINSFVFPMFMTSTNSNEPMFSFSIPLWLILINMVFTTLIGILSGYLPARKAMRCSALEAIKNG